MKYILLLLSQFTIGILLAQSDKIIGTWLTQDQTAHIEIYTYNGKYYGKIVWLKHQFDEKTKKERLDSENPDPKRRNAKLIGIDIVKDFVKNQNEYVGGTVYDSRNGKTYKGKIWLTNENTLMLRGYSGWFYSTETWTRVR